MAQKGRTVDSGALYEQTSRSQDILKANAEKIVSLRQLLLATAQSYAAIGGRDQNNSKATSNDYVTQLRIQNDMLRKEVAALKTLEVAEHAIQFLKDTADQIFNAVNATGVDPNKGLNQCIKGIDELRSRIEAHIETVKTIRRDLDIDRCKTHDQSITDLKDRIQILQATLVSSRQPTA